MPLIVSLLIAAAAPHNFIFLARLPHVFISSPRSDEIIPGTRSRGPTVSAAKSGFGIIVIHLSYLGS